MGEDLNYTELVRLLCCEFEIRTNSRKLADRLSLITQHAEQDLPVVQHSTLTLTWTGEEFFIRGDGIEDDFELSVNSTLEAVYNRLHYTAVEAMPDYIRIGAATGSNRGHAFLIIGPARAGKTTLALALMLDGIDITGDASRCCAAGKRLPSTKISRARERYRPHLGIKGIGQVRRFDRQSPRKSSRSPRHAGVRQALADCASTCFGDVLARVQFRRPDHGTA
jgi:hypothetical protein